MKQMLGVDIGKVLRGKLGNGKRSATLEEFLAARPPMEGAREGLGLLRKDRFGTNMVAISRCEGQPQEWTRRWLEHYGFLELLGARPEALIFSSLPAEKAQICQQLGCTHFIDNQWPVLRHMPKAVEGFLFKPSYTDLCRFACERHTSRSSVKLVHTWGEVVHELLGEPTS